MNLMPDGAFDATEQQFCALIDSGAGDEQVTVHRYSAASVARGPEAAARIAAAYRPLAALADDRPHAVIVTGTEPIADELRDEPYWEELTALIDWSAANAASLLLSCLSAHAGLLHLDGIARRRLPDKLSGVFAHDVAGRHPLTAGIDGPVPIPHSRFNDADGASLQARGYQLGLTAPGAGWAVAWRDLGPCLLVLTQGHPEYAGATLLKEYRRDARRFLDGERQTPPDIPVGYIGGPAALHLDAYHRELIERRDPPFPYNDVIDAAVAVWQPAAGRLFSNWLHEVRRRSASVQAA